MKKIELENEEKLFEVSPYHTIYYRILCERNDRIIQLDNMGKYFKCEWIISNKLYQMFDKEEYELSTWSGSEYKAKELKETYKYNHQQTKIGNFAELFYNFNKKELIILNEPNSLFDNDVMFPIGTIEENRKLIETKDWNEYTKDMKQIVIKH